MILAESESIPKTAPRKYDPFTSCGKKFEILPDYWDWG